MVSAAEYLPSAAIVGSKLHCYPEIEKVQFDGISVSYRGVSTRSNEPEKILSVPFVSGASMLIRSEFLKRCGLLREDYFLYFEDNEICLRANREGFMVLYNPLSVVYHKGGASVGDFMESPLSIYYGIRNSLFYYEEWNEKGVEEILSLVERTLIPKIILEQDKTKLESLFQAIEDFLLTKRGIKGDYSDATSAHNFPLKLYDHLLRLSDSMLKRPIDVNVIRVYLDLARSLIKIRLKEEKTV